MMHWSPSGFGHDRQRRRRRYRAALLLVVTLVLATDTVRPPGVHRIAEARETLRIVGSRSLVVPVSRWARAFRRVHPEIRITTSLYGTGIATGALADGLADIAPLHRTLKPDERRFLDTVGVTLMLIPVASRDQPAIYIYVRQPAIGRPEPAALEFARVALRVEEPGSTSFHPARAFP